MKTTRRNLLGLFLAPFVPTIAKATTTRYPEATIRADDPGAEYVEVLDLNTGEVLPLVQAVNVKEGWVEQIRHQVFDTPPGKVGNMFNSRGRTEGTWVLASDKDGTPVVDRKYGSYKIRPVVTHASYKTCKLESPTSGRMERLGITKEAEGYPTQMEYSTTPAFEIGSNKVIWLKKLVSLTLGKRP